MNGEVGMITFVCKPRRLVSGCMDRIIVRDFRQGKVLGISPFHASGSKSTSSSSPGIGSLSSEIKIGSNAVFPIEDGAV